MKRRDFLAASVVASLGVVATPLSAKITYTQEADTQPGDFVNVYRKIGDRWRPKAFCADLLPHELVVRAQIRDSKLRSLGYRIVSSRGPFSVQGVGNVETAAYPILATFIGCSEPFDLTKSLVVKKMQKFKTTKPVHFFVAVK